MGLIAEFLGSIVGGIIWGTLLGLLFGKLLFSEDAPDDRALKAVLVASFAIFIISAWGHARGASLNPAPALINTLMSLPGLFLAWLYLRRSYRKAWIDDDSTFD